MGDIEARCNNWGRVFRRRRSGYPGSVPIWDGYYRAKHWGDDSTHSLDPADVADAWIIERAVTHPNMLRIYRVSLVYHYVATLDPRTCCRLIFDNLQVKIRAKYWEQHLSDSRDALCDILATPISSGFAKPLAQCLES